MDSESERRRIDEQAASLNSQPSVGDHSIAASGPNVGQQQGAMDEKFMAQMGEFMKRFVGAVQPTPPAQPANPPPVQKSPIERVRKYGAEDFKGLLTDDSPAAEYWLERTERIMEQIHCSEAEKLECAVSLLQESAYQWWRQLKGVSAVKQLIGLYSYGNFVKSTLVMHMLRPGVGNSYSYSNAI